MSPPDADVDRTLPPMLGRLVRTLPRGGYVYEPKWDGFRCLAFRSGEDVDLRSRHGRPFARYFPEVVERLRQLPAPELVLDGEILVATPGGWDFPSLMARLHPAASRVDRLARETPATYVAFDVLSVGGEELLHRPATERRTRLEDLLADAPDGIRLTPQTADPDLAAAWLAGDRPAGTDGVMAKPADGVYEPGARAMLKVKLERTADCVVGGLRVASGAEPVASSLLLGLYDDEGALRHVGVASSFGRRLGRELLERLLPSRARLEEHPWEQGFLLEGGALGRLKGAAGRWAPGMPMDWLPLRPEHVCEVAYTQVDAGRFRHPARLRRFREDRDPRSCRFDQLVEHAAGA